MIRLMVGRFGQNVSDWCAPQPDIVGAPLVRCNLVRTHATVEIHLTFSEALSLEVL